MFPVQRFVTSAFAKRSSWPRKPRCSFGFVLGSPPTPPQNRLEKKKRKEDSEEGRVAGMGRFNRPMISHLQPKLNPDQAAATARGSFRAAAGCQSEPQHRSGRGEAQARQCSRPRQTPALRARAGGGPTSQAPPKPARPKLRFRELQPTGRCGAALENCLLFQGLRIASIRLERHLIFSSFDLPRWGPEGLIPAPGFPPSLRAVSAGAVCSQRGRRAGWRGAGNAEEKSRN